MLDLNLPWLWLRDISYALECPEVSEHKGPTRQKKWNIMWQNNTGEITNPLLAIIPIKGIIHSKTIAASKETFRISSKINK